MKYEEAAAQRALFQRAGYRRYRNRTLREFMFAVPNAGTSGGRRALLAGVRRKAEGVTAGVPDVECVIAVPPFHGLHIEMKRKDGKPTDVTESQRDMMALLSECGRKCVVAYGEEMAWQELTSYLGIKP